MGNEREGEEGRRREWAHIQVKAPNQNPKYATAQKCTQFRKSELVNEIMIMKTLIWAFMLQT